MRERLELPRFKVHDADHDAVVAALRTAMGDSEVRGCVCRGSRHYLPRRQSAYAMRGRGERKRPPSG